MTIGSLYLLGLIPAGLILLVGVLIFNVSASKTRKRNLLLYLLAVGVFALLAMWIAVQLTPEGDNQPFSQVTGVLAPSLLGVLALILLNLGVLLKLRGRALFLASLLALFLVALIIALWNEPGGILFYILPGALILGLTWAAARKTGGLPVVLSLIVLALLAALDLYSSSLRGELPDWLSFPIGLIYFALPGVSVALAAIMISDGLNKITSNPAQSADEARPVSRSPAYLRFVLAGLLLGALAYRIYWSSIWDQTDDGLAGIFFTMPASLVAIGAGMIMGMKSAGVQRLYGVAFALLVPILMFGAFRGGWEVDYHAITDARARRIQGALEQFHQRNGRYPSDLTELAPRDLLIIPQPVIFEDEGWCYESALDGYRLGAVYREFFGTPLSIKIYAAAGGATGGETPGSELPNDPWACQRRLAELQAVYEPAPFYGQEIFVPTEEPLPTSQVAMSGALIDPIIWGEFLSWGDRSPEGRYLPISQVVSSEETHTIALSFLEVESGRVCQVEEQFPVQPNPWGPELRQYGAWSPTGSFLYLTQFGDIVELHPCDPGTPRPVENEQEPFERIAAYHPESGRVLLQTKDAYWIMDTESMAIRQMEGVSPNPNEFHWDNFAWSPQGDLLAISHLNGRNASEGSTLFVLSAADGKIAHRLPMEAASEQSAPWVEWLSRHEILLSGVDDLLLLELNGATPEATKVIKEIFDLDLSFPDETSAWGSVIDGPGEYFHLALRTNQPGNQDLYVYHSESGEVEILHPGVHGFLIFPDGQSLEMPRFSFERVDPDEYEIFWIDQPGKPSLSLSPQGHTPRSYPLLSVRYLPESERLAFSSSQGVSLVSLPEGKQLEFWRLSGEGHISVLAGENEQALVAEREQVNEAELFSIPLPP